MIHWFSFQQEFSQNASWEWTESVFVSVRAAAFSARTAVKVLHKGEGWSGRVKGRYDKDGMAVHDGLMSFCQPLYSVWGQGKQEKMRRKMESVCKRKNKNKEGDRRTVT